MMMEKPLPIRDDDGRLSEEKLKNRVPREDQAPTSTTDDSASTAGKQSNAALHKPNNGLVASITAWYATSVVCTNTSKSLGLPWQWLTLAQLVIGSCSAYFGIAVLHLNGKPSSRGVRLADLFPSSHAIWQSTIILAAAFVGGFVTLNMALRQMHVSTVMTVRAAEPVATFLLGLYFLPNEKTTLRAMLALIPVVAGAAMASTVSTSSADSEEDRNSFAGLWIVLLCNCLFALRTICTKRLKAACPALDNFTLFFQLCVIGTVLQLILLCSMSALAMLRPQSTENAEPATSWTAVVGIEEDESVLPKLMVLIVNGVSFYAYLQLSWVVMGQVGAVTHSVCNALRRPVICAVGWMVFGGATLPGIAGALVATGGTLLYAQAKLQAAAAAAQEEDSEDTSKAQPKLQVV